MISPALTLRLEMEIESDSRGGFWRFTFLTIDGQLFSQAEDWEPDISRDRLELLTLVRALESLEYPSVVLLSRVSPYLEEGIRFGLPQWRTEAWRWEYFDHAVPICHQDLWQRLDWDLRFHRLILPSEQRGNLVAAAASWPSSNVSVYPLGGDRQSRVHRAIRKRIDGPKVPAGIGKKAGGPWPNDP